MVAVANGFFIANATLGILAGMRLFRRKMLKVGAGILALLFILVLLFSHILVILTISVMAISALLTPAHKGKLIGSVAALPGDRKS
jgi:APA family basic amino acid/polyamine antiporter